MWLSRRPNVLGRGGAVSCDQVQASLIGYKILENGGTAADAAIGVAAALNVLQPAAYGIGGDAWVLYYEKSSKTVFCLDGSGKSSSNFTPEKVVKTGLPVGSTPSMCSALTVTVPGACAAWCDLRERFGNTAKYNLYDLFKPAVDLARNGYAVSELAAYLFRVCDQYFKDEGYDVPDLFLYPCSGKVPKPGQVMRNPDLADTYEEIGKYGKKAFYTGRIAESIVDCVQNNGGLLTLDDLASHCSQFIEPISVPYFSKKLSKPFRIYETAPSSQGVVALESLKILECLAIDKLKSPDVQYTHVVLEALKLAFEDLSNEWKTCSSGCLGPDVPEKLLSLSHIRSQAALLDLNRARQSSMTLGSDFEKYGRAPDTTYFCVVDKEGNACSVVASNYWYLGTPLVPQNCGFTLHNRGYAFWQYMHGKIVPEVRPYHTLCTGMIANEHNDFLAAFGCQGGINQPQAQLQILLDLLEFGMSPQEALDRARFMIEYKFSDNDGIVYMEDSPSGAELRSSLNMRGHKTGPILTGFDRNMCGRGHIISKGSWWDFEGKYGRDESVLWAGCDPRSDGAALALY